METLIIDDAQADEWEQFIAQHPDSIAWQSTAWNEVLNKHYPVTFYRIVARDDSGIHGILPLYHVRTRLNKGSLISVPYAVAGGIVADDADITSLLLAEALRMATKHDACRITLKQYKIKVEGDLLTDANFYNRELALSSDLDALLNAFSDTNRRAIEQAQEQDLALEYPSSDIGGFYKTLLEHHHRRGIPCVSKRWILDLVGCGMYSFALLKHEDRVLGGTMVKEFKTTVSFPFTCVSEKEREDDVPYALYWELIKHFALRGVEILHSGRIPRSNETDAYRLGWGGQEHGYYYQYMPNTGAKTEYAKKRGRKRQMMASCWKRMPRSAARLLGPAIVREYP